jgi:hypothetical protein
MVGALSHVKNVTIADFTGTFTGFNSQGSTTTINATDIVRPTDWVSAHNAFLTLSGNTAGQSTMSGTNIVLAGGLGIVLSATTAAGAATVSVGLLGIVTGLPVVIPGSTGTQSRGAMGTSSASLFLYPFFLDNYVAFNAIRMLQTHSLVSSTISGQQTISSRWGIFTLNVETLSLLTSFSLSQAWTQSSVSGTVSFATTTLTSGYGYGTSSFSTTALGQSLFGTAFPRIVDLVLSSSALTFSPGRYWLGLLQVQSSSSANIGLSSGHYGNVIATQMTQGLAGGVSVSNTTDYRIRLPGFGVYTVTQTSMPGNVPLTQINHSLTNMPYLSLTST